MGLFFINLVMGGIVLSLMFLLLHKNFHNQLNKSFAYFLGAAFLWIFTNYFSNDTTLDMDLSLWINHILLAVSSLLIALLVNFCLVLAESPRLKSYKRYVLTIATANAVLAMTPLVISGSSIQDRAIALEFGSLAWVYFLVILSFCMVVIGQLIKALFSKKGAKRQKAIVMLSGLVLTVLFAAFTNVLMPFVMNDFSLTSIGPLFSIFIFISAGYAIVRLKLFDVRIFAARALAYILALGAISAAYAAVVYGFLERAFELPQSNTTARIVYIGMAVLLSLSFAPIKRFFDKLTDKLFFRGEYKTQEVLSDVGKIAADEINLETIAEKSLIVTSKALKSHFAQIVVLSKSDGSLHQFSTGEKIENLGDDFKKDFIKRLSKTDGKVYLVSDLSEGAAKIFEELGAAVLIKLQTSSQVVGYMVIGYKQNGNSYNTRDMHLLETIGTELGLALINSLRFLEIQNFNKTLQQKVDEATKELQSANEKLRVIDQAKDEFISMASHQLRTPLTSIKGYLAMVLDGDAGKLKDKQKHLLMEAFTSSQRMVYLISDFLNVSRIQTGKFMLDAKPIDFAELVQQEVEQMHIVAESKSRMLVFERPDSFPMVEVDENKIRQVIMNLIDNAISYSRKGGVVNVELSLKANHATLKVRDSGIGVPPADRHKLFTKFFRAGNAQMQRPDGTGIGLFMAKKVVMEHGGTIIFESKENVGSTFGFSIPLKQPNSGRLQDGEGVVV